VFKGSSLPAGKIGKNHDGISVLITRFTVGTDIQTFALVVSIDT
jgi:hypothetical protein